MKPITLRNLPPAVAAAVREKARKERISLNRAVAVLLEKATSTATPPRRGGHEDLDRFAGTWSRGDAEEFDAYLEEQRRVDKDDWK